MWAVQIVIEVNEGEGVTLGFFYNIIYCINKNRASFIGNENKTVRLERYDLAYFWELKYFVKSNDWKTILEN
jgi:hypothetical protein